MNCGFCHEKILAGRLRETAEECGATVREEQPVRMDGTVSYADLVITKDGLIIVCEPEQSRHRVLNDVRKAAVLGAHLLLIVTPDSLTAQSCRRQLRRCPPLDSKIKVICCPLGSALEILRQTLTGLPLFDPDFNNFQRFGFCKWRICKGCPARRRSKGLVVQTYPVPIGGVLCIIMSHHVSQTFISS